MSASVQVDSKLKEEAQTLFASLDFDLSTAVNMFFRAAIDFQGFPFAIRRYNEETEQAIQESQDILSGKVAAKRYNSAAEMIADILAEDDDT